MVGYQRHRSTSDLVESSVVARNYTSNGVLGSTYTYPSSRLTRFQEFLDVVNDAGQVHPAYNGKITQVPYPGLRFTHSSGSYTVYDSVYLAVNGVDVGLLFPGPSSNLVGELADKAYDALFPQIPQEVSIPNFLYELRDISALLPKLEEGIVKSAGSGFLNYSFGWKPFIGDIQKIRGLMETVRARLEYLKSTYGRETRISYQTSFDPEGPEVVDKNPVFHTRKSFRGIFRCSGYLYHELQDLDGLIGEFRALLGATGFNNPLGVIWEAIPYSFVVDWFSRVGSLVSRTPIQPFVGPWEIRRLTHSYTISGTYESVKKYFGAYTHSGHGSPDWIFATGTFARYIRGVGLPVSAALLSADGLNPQQQLLAAALLSSAGR